MNLFKVHSRGTTHTSMPCCFSIPIAIASFLCIYFSLYSKRPTSTTALCPASTLNSIHYEKSKYDSALVRRVHTINHLLAKIWIPLLFQLFLTYTFWFYAPATTEVPFSTLKKNAKSHFCHASQHLLLWPTEFYI